MNIFFAMIVYVSIKNTNTELPVLLIGHSLGQLNERMTVSRNETEQRVPPPLPEPIMEEHDSSVQVAIPA